MNVRTSVEFTSRYNVSWNPLNPDFIIAYDNYKTLMNSDRPIDDFIKYLVQQFVDGGHEEPALFVGYIGTEDGTYKGEPKTGVCINHSYPFDKIIVATYEPLPTKKAHQCAAGSHLNRSNRAQ